MLSANCRGAADVVLALHLFDLAAVFQRPGIQPGERLTKRLPEGRQRILDTDRRRGQHLALDHPVPLQPTKRLRKETAKIAQNEALLGIMPGGGGTQYLLERIGRSRALEVVLAADLLDADTAAAYGWINRAIPAAELDTFVDTIAKNIAALGAEVIAAVKRVLPTADLTAGLKEENTAWSTLLSTEKPAKMMTGAIENDLQTPEGERDVEKLLRRIAANL